MSSATRSAAPADIEVDAAVLGCGIVGSYIAARLRERGQRVALVDRAPAPGAPKREPDPTVAAGSRPHQGLVEARHHELGGNSAYWGGAMLRIPPADLPGIIDTATITPDALARAYEEVERVLDMPGATRRVPAPDTSAGLGAMRTNACVLPARSKHFFASMVKPHLSAHVPLFDVSIAALETRDGELKAIIVTGADGRQTRLRASRFYLTMGVIDSLLFAQRFQTSLFHTPMPALGRHLHEHVSVPLFKVQANASGDFLRHWVPRFEGRFMQVPRIEFPLHGIRCGWDPRAFIHFVCDFDSVGVYHDIKQILAARQAGTPMPELAGRAFGLAPRVLEIARIGVDRFLAKRLYVSREVPVTAVLDFESFPHIENRLEGTPAAMHWDIRAEDRAAFRGLAPVAAALVKGLALRHGFTATPLTRLDDATALEKHLMAEGKDILHLGGGLQSTGGQAVVAGDLSFPAASNLCAVSTAVLARGSVVNPTHSLLALAQWRMDRSTATAHYLTDSSLARA